MKRNETVKTIRDQERVEILVTTFIGCLLFFMSFYYSRYMQYHTNGPDITAHLELAFRDTFAENVKFMLMGSHRLWHISVRILAKLGVGHESAAALVCGAALALAYGVAVAMLRDFFPKLNRTAISLGCLAYCVASAFYIPWFTGRIYLGQSSPNVWHSPTQIMVRPFILMVFWMTVRIYTRYRKEGWGGTKVYSSKKEAALYAGVILLSVWAKPCGFQTVVPALGILLVIDLVRSRGKSFWFCVKMAAAYVPGAMSTLLQFNRAILSESTGGGIEIAPLEVWHIYSDNVAISILIVMAFPFFVMLMDRKDFFRSVDGQLALSCLFVGGMMNGLLAETGPRRTHGNFGWSWQIGVTVFWIVAIGRFLRMMWQDDLDEKKYKAIAYPGWALLALHVLSGIYYYWSLTTGTRQC